MSFWMHVMVDPTGFLDVAHDTRLAIVDRSQAEPLTVCDIDHSSPCWGRLAYYPPVPTKRAEKAQLEKAQDVSSIRFEMSLSNNTDNGCSGRWTLPGARTNTSQSASELWVEELNRNLSFHCSKTNENNVPLGSSFCSQRILFDQIKLNPTSGRAQFLALLSNTAEVEHLKFWRKVMLVDRVSETERSTHAHTLQRIPIQKWNKCNTVSPRHLTFGSHDRCWEPKLWSSLQHAELMVILQIMQIAFFDGF